MNKQKIIIYPILIFLLILTGCSSLMTGLYGIKSLNKIDDKTILSYAKKIGIPERDVYHLDYNYFSYLFSLDTTEYKAQIRNHSQPLQARYYDKSGELKSFHVNCHAGGFPNLKWNRNNVMSTFLPGEQTPVDTIFPLERQKKYLIPLPQTELTDYADYDYIVIVFWNRFMGRQSKRLIRYVQDNSKLATDKSVKIIYVNNDNSFYKIMNNGSRQHVIASNSGAWR